MPLEEHSQPHSLMLKTNNSIFSSENKRYKHVARSVTVLSSAVSISFTFSPTLSIIFAPFSYKSSHNNQEIKKIIELDYLMTFDLYLM